MLAGQGGERGARAQLDEQRLRELGLRGADRAGEAHRLAQVACPVGRVGGLGGAQHAAGEGGDDVAVRRVQRHAAHQGLEGRHGGVHHGRVEGVRGLQWPRGDAIGLEPRLQGLDAGGGTGGDAGRGTVLGRQRHAIGGGHGQVGRQAFGRQAHRQHAAGRQRLHQGAAPRHQARRVGQRHHAGDPGGGELAHAVADHGGRAQAQMQGAAGQGVFEREGGRLRDRRRRQGGGIVGEQAFAQVEGQLAREGVAGLVQRRAEDLVVDIERASHAGVLRALAREQQHRFVHARRGGAGDGIGRCGVAQDLDGLGHAIGHHGQAPREGLAPDAQRVRHVAEVAAGMRRQVVGQSRAHGGQCLGRARRQRQQPGSGDRLGRLRQRRLLQDHVGVGAADAERADAGAARGAVPARPVGEMRVDVERRALEVDRRIGALVVQGRGQAFLV